MSSADAIRRTRAASQWLHRPVTASATQVVARLLAVQAQDMTAAPLALRARTRGLTAGDVTAARDRKEIVRLWGPRGTLHLVGRDDAGWLTGLVLGASRGNALRRLGQEGVTGTPEELLAAVRTATVGRGPLTKAELTQALDAAGCRARGQGVVYLAFLGALHGAVMLGPDRGGKPTYVSTLDWLGAELTPEPDRSRALAELAVRYLRSHAPAAPEDLATWSGLPVTQCRAAWSAIGDRLVEIEYDGRPLWHLRESRFRSMPMKTVLLPAFDEYLLGWRDRSLMLPPAHARAINAGGGMIRPVIVADAVVVGTWQPNGSAPAFFGDPCDLRAELADIARFRGR